MKIITLHNKNEIENYLQQNVFLHIYSLGDLDDFFWPYTLWYASKTNDKIEALILLYIGQAIPIVLAFSDNIDPLQNLLNALQPLLPRRFYAHLQPGLESVLEQQFRMEFHGDHYKMGLMNKLQLAQIDTSEVSNLSAQDIGVIHHLYKRAYPGNWFDARMLETKQYFGIKNRGVLVSIAGIHVYSEKYKVASLGNITTDPDYRGQGLGQATTAKLCQSLSQSVDYIGLNVKTDNQSAIAMYKKLGFEIVSPYKEYTITATVL